MRLLLLFLALSLPVCALAQNDCDLGQVADTTPLVYPPIARAAHVSGLVLMRVSFKPTGEADHIEVLSGPEMLKQSATSYVQGWKASPYPGIRNCPITIEYSLLEPSFDDNCNVVPQGPSLSIVKVDAQRVRIEQVGAAICDPAATVIENRSSPDLWHILKRLFSRK